MEASSPGLAPYEKQFWQYVATWLKDGPIRPGKFRIVEGLERVGEINAALDDYMTAKGGRRSWFIRERCVWR